VRSSRLAERRAQSGQSLVEVLIASMVLGLGIVTALTSLDTMMAGARVASEQAWATCAVRAEVGAVEAAAWGDVSSYPTMANVTVTPSQTQPIDAGLQSIDVTARDSRGRALLTATVLKADVLSGAGPPSSNLTPPIGAWCSYVTRAAP